jgi:hypothetical protein
MDPKDFVGAIISLHDENKKPTDWVLLEFLGEGNSGIAYRIAPLSNPTTEMRVAKFPKSDVRFQMTVLHSSLRIAEGLFPKHPQRLTPDERLRRLTEEMLLRMASPGAAFGVKAYRTLLMATEDALVKLFYRQFKAKTLTDDFLSKVSALTQLIDENLVEEIELSLDENLAVEKRLFYEHCLTSLSKRIEDLKLENAFRPLLQNVLVKLLGLHLEGFIDFTELLTITRTKAIHEQCTSVDFTDLAALIPLLYNCTVSEKQKSNSESELDRKVSEYTYPTAIRATIATALYLEECAAQYSPSLSYLSGLAKSWLARVNILTGQPSRAIMLFEEALQFLTTEESLPERYDALLDLAKLLLNSEPDRAYAYAGEALTLKATLGYD